MELRAGLVRALLLGATIALLLIAAGPLIIRLAILLFEPTARVAAEFASYVGIRLLGAPAGLANLVLLGWLLGLQNARGPMALLIVTNAVNIALALVFVLGLAGRSRAWPRRPCAPSTAVWRSGCGWRTAS